MKKTISLILALVLTFSLIGCGKKEPFVEIVSTPKEEQTPEPTENPFSDLSPEDVIDALYGVKEISKHGNVVIDVPASEIAEMFTPGDLVKIGINDKSFIVPVGTSYTDVDMGEMILRLDSEDDEASLAVNNGNFYDLLETEEEDFIIEASMHEKQGYIDEYNIRHLERSNLRADYPNLTDEEYANFREVSFGNIKQGMLYRSTSPIDPEIGRSEFADALMEQYGIKAVVNIDENEDEMYEYEGYNSSYYSTCNIANIMLTFDYESQDNQMKMADIARFITENEGPFLVHCKEGKDRTGYVFAVIGALMGADLDEIEDDYMKTYINFYGISENDEIFEKICENITEKTLAKVFKTDDIKSCDLEKCAHDYLSDAGLSDEEINAFKAVLAK